MQKIKSSNTSNFLTILKCSFLAITLTLIGIILLAVVLKFVEMSSTAIASINNVIKGLAIFLMMFCIKKNSSGKLILKSVVAGTVYSLLSFLIFSILDVSFNLSMLVVYDLLFAVTTAMISSVILNVLARK